MWCCRHYLNQGYPTPLPPPPPPRPGDPGYEEYVAAATARHKAQTAAAQQAREAAGKARQQAAAAQQADAGSNSSAAVLDAWSSLKAAGGDASTAWESSAVPSDVGDAVSNNDTVTAENSAAWGSSVDGPGDAAAGSNPWDIALQSPGNNSDSSRVWADVQDGSQSSQAATPSVASPSPLTAPTTAAASVPLIPVAVPIAVPVPIPNSAPLAAPVPAAVPVATPVVPSQAAAAAAAPNRSLLHPAPFRDLQQRQPALGSVAVADFNTAAPARLNPGVSPSLQSGPYQQPQQHRQQLIITSRPSSAGTATRQLGLQEAQTQQQRPNSAIEHQRSSWACNVCTYEHSGPEAQFLFCAMCSSQRPADS